MDWIHFKGLLLWLCFWCQESGIFPQIFMLESFVNFDIWNNLFSICSGARVLQRSDGFFQGFQGFEIVNAKNKSTVDG